MCRYQQDVNRIVLIEMERRSGRLAAQNRRFKIHRKLRYKTNTQVRDNQYIKCFKIYAYVPVSSIVKDKHVIG